MQKFIIWGKESKFFKLLIKTLLFVLFFYIIFTFVLGIHYCTDNNMYPKIGNGDLVVTYKLERLNINDPVLYKASDGKIHCGRIIAASGDEVKIDKQGNLIVDDGVKIEEIFYPTSQGKYGSVENKEEKGYKVKENSYFILNDFRSDINDSRTYGVINKKDIKGKVVFQMRCRGF